VLYVGIVNVIAIGKFSNVVFLILRRANWIKIADAEARE
jgi:hypothetical protein